MLSFRSPPLKGVEGHMHRPRPQVRTSVYTHTHGFEDTGIHLFFFFLKRAWGVPEGKEEKNPKTPHPVQSRMWGSIS